MKRLILATLLSYSADWPRWKINSFLSEISVCWSCMEKIMIKIGRAFSVILRASPAIRRSSQPSPQHPTVPSKPLIKYAIGDCKCKMASSKPHHCWLYQWFVVCMLTQTFINRGRDRDRDVYCRGRDVYCNRCCNHRVGELTCHRLLLIKVVTVAPTWRQQ